MTTLVNNYNCDYNSNWMNNGPSYSQISLTDGCSNNICDANPVYSTNGTNNNDAAVRHCKIKCDNMTSCEGFFFQKHNNGHEICGFYSSGMEDGTWVWGGHQAGAICWRRFYMHVSSGDCDDTNLITTKDECEEAYEEVFPDAEDVDATTWNTSAYARGCFKHNWGGTGATALAFNLDGGPGTSGHCTAEPSYAACICRRVYGTGSRGPAGHLSTGSTSALLLAAEIEPQGSEINYPAITCAIGGVAILGYALYRNLKTKKAQTEEFNLLN